MNSTNQGSVAGEHPVLEFLGTLRMAEGVLQDSLQSDADVVSVLAGLGWAIRFQGRGLLAVARGLREEVRRLVERRKTGKPLVLARLNEFLAASRSHLTLQREKSGALALQRQWACETPEQALAPVAEAAAELLATGDFELVRHCEGEGCVLWFYDRTKSHRRRWCSMASCGNRHKVTAFRKRQEQG